MAKMPVQKPGKSEQVVCTPKDFLSKVRLRLGIVEFDIDLAADKDNSVCMTFYDEKANALTKPWRVWNGWGWCNPPYADIEPWVKKAHEEVATGAKTAMLVPASVGSNWWRDYVDGKAHAILLNGRITFVGHDDCYPKDLALLLYSPMVKGGYEVWSWK